jgi:hypothetical protein
VGLNRARAFARLLEVIGRLVQHLGFASLDPRYREEMAWGMDTDDGVFAELVSRDRARAHVPNVGMSQTRRTGDFAGSLAINDA